MMKPMKISLSLLMLFFLTSCLAAFDNMKADINDLKSESYETKKEVMNIKTSLSSIEKAISDLKIQMENTTKVDSVAALKESQTSLYSQVGDLGKEVQSLRGLGDEARHSLETALKEAPKDKAALTARLDELDKAVKELREKISVFEKPLIKPEPVSEEKVYEEAYNLFNEKKYSDARGMFASFIKTYPNHKLVGNAQFWIAETYYAQKDFESAILAYEDLLKKYKDNPKAPSAMLKQALAFIELKDKKTAIGILKEILEKYPESEQAKTAAKKLKEIEKTKP